MQWTQRQKRKMKREKKEIKGGKILKGNKEGKNRRIETIKKTEVCIITCRPPPPKDPGESVSVNISVQTPLYVLVYV